MHIVIIAIMQIVIIVIAIVFIIAIIDLSLLSHSPNKRSCRENVTEKREKCKLYINCICEISLFIGLSMVEHLSVIAEVEHSSVR